MVMIVMKFLKDICFVGECVLSSGGNDGGDGHGDGDGDDDDDGYRVQTKLEAISRVWHLPQPSQQLLSMRRRRIWRMLMLIACCILKTGL